MLCALYQWFISSALDAGRPLGPRTRRHLARCPQCRRFHEAGLGIERRLRAQAAAAPPPREVLASRPGRLWRPALAAAAVLALVAGGAALWWPAKPARPVAKPEVAVKPAPPALPWMADVSAARASATGLGKLATDSVRKEMDLLARDAKATTLALLSCLPTGLMEEQTTSGPARPER